MQPTIHDILRQVAIITVRFICPLDYWQGYRPLA
jgi:hypothetical protein